MIQVMQAGPTILRVARWIEHDIVERGLRVGDPYLTAAQLAEVLNVSRATVDRAMRQLAHREVLTRRQKSGTFVGRRSGAEAAPIRALDVVHVLLSTDYVRAGLVATDVLADTLSSTLGGAAVDMHFIPEADSFEYVSHVTQRIGANHKSAEGILLIRASREAQLLVENSEIPAVVFGSVYPEIKRLPWLDVDQAGAGSVAAGYALETGCRRFVLLTRDQWRRGDNLLLEGVTRELAAADVGLDELTIVSIPQSENVIERQVMAALRGASGPVALICRNTVFADCAMRTAAANGFVFQRDYHVISTQAAPGRTPYAHVSPSMGNESQIRWLAEHLGEVAKGALLSRPAAGGGVAHKLVQAVLVRPEEDGAAAHGVGAANVESRGRGGKGRSAPTKKRNRSER